MGMNHGGEIHELSRCGAPDVSVITNIGDAHIENFITGREGILHAKLEIVDGLKKDGTVIFNGDDPLLTGEIAQTKLKIFGPFNARYPGEANIYSIDMHSYESRCQFVFDGELINITIPLPGRHIVQDALLAVSVGLELGLSAAEITRGFAALVPPADRLNLIHAHGMEIINDAYNANPESMQASIKVVQTARKKRSVCILGDMAELGDVSEARHKQVGAFAAQTGIDLLIAIGPMARWLYEGFNNSDPVRALHFDTLEDFLPHWRDILQFGDTVLVKASNSMQFKHIVDAIKN